MKRIAVLFVTTGFLFGMGLIAWWLSQRTTEQPFSAQTPPIELRLKSDCDLAQRPCHAEFADLKVDVIFLSQPHYLQPFAAEVVLRGARSVTVEQVSMQFMMHGMQMSLPAAYLQKTATSEQQTTRWKNKVMIPVCTSGRHDWSAEVGLTSAEKRYTLQFKLQMP